MMATPVVAFLPMASRPIFHADLGRYFATLRERHGWTQRQATSVARRRGIVAIARQTIWRLEIGKVKHPDAEVLRAVAVLYDVSYEDLVIRCVDAAYGVKLRVAKEGERARPAAHVLVAFGPEEQRLLECFRGLKGDKKRKAALQVLEVLCAPSQARSARPAVPESGTLEQKPRRKRESQS
jgi:transcriptional regulator with XRE-family HTH domain